MHVVDAVLKSPPDALARAVVHQALQNSIVEFCMQGVVDAVLKPAPDVGFQGCNARCMQGVVHIIDAVLKPPPDALARAVVHQALQDFGVKGSMTPARRLGPRCRGDGIPRARLRLLVGGEAYREDPETGQGAVALQVPSLPQALPWHQPASQHVIRNGAAPPGRGPKACLQRSAVNGTDQLGRGGQGEPSARTPAPHMCYQQNSSANVRSLQL